MQPPRYTIYWGRNSTREVSGLGRKPPLALFG
jgi:hypothetical protein